MEKRQVLSIVTLICYVVMVAVGALLAFYGYNTVGQLEGTNAGFAGFAVGIASVVVVVIGLIYAAIGVLPIIFKIIHLFADSKVPSVLCFIFDLAYIALNGCFLYQACLDGAVNTIAVTGALTAVSLVALITNVAAMTD